MEGPVNIRIFKTGVRKFRGFAYRHFSDVMQGTSRRLLGCDAV